MNNLTIKKEQGRIFASLNNNYNTSNVINVELINAEKKTTKAKVKCKTLTSSKKANTQFQNDKLLNQYSNNCGDLSITATTKKQLYIDARKNARKKL